jgi:hypothetical protein
MDGTPDETINGRCPRPIDAILAAVRSLPDATLEMDFDRGCASVHVGVRLVANIDLRRGDVLVYLPIDRIPTLRCIFPSARAAPTGILFDLACPQSCSETLAAIRRRANMETLAPRRRIDRP